MSNKQSKNDKLVQAAATGAIVVDAAAEQAPVLPASFAPYAANPNYEDPYSETLLTKANGLAKECFKDQAGYDAFTKSMKWTLDEGPNESITITKNRKFFDHGAIDRALQNAVSIRLGMLREPWATSTKLAELLKKVRKLEKIYDDYEILDEEARERIINTVLLPTSQFGVHDFATGSPGLRYPMQKSVVAEMLTDEEVGNVDSVISYLPQLRELMSEYTPYTQGATKEDLLEPLLPETDPSRPMWLYHAAGADAKLIKRIRQIRRFFEAALPSNLQYDYIPASRYPSNSMSNYTKVVAASNTLRDVSEGFIREDKRLSDLLAAIIELADKMRQWLSAEVTDLASFFHYLNRIGMSYETLVEESKERIRDSDAPW